jgi:hypothetical protein
MQGRRLLHTGPGELTGALLLAQNDMYHRALTTHLFPVGLLPKKIAKYEENFCFVAFICQPAEGQRR